MKKTRNKKGGDSKEIAIEIIKRERARSRERTREIERERET